MINNSKEHMPRMQGILGSNPGGIWQVFCFISLDIPNFKTSKEENNYNRTVFFPCKDQCFMYTHRVKLHYVCEQKCTSKQYCRSLDFTKTLSILAWHKYHAVWSVYRYQFHCQVAIDLSCLVVDRFLWNSDCTMIGLRWDFQLLHTVLRRQEIVTSSEP